MKKILLLLIVVLQSVAYAQGVSCSAATEITANGTFNCPTITGTYTPICLNGTATIKAMWYKYTATANGEVTISSNLPANTGTAFSNDTRVTIQSGASCTTLSCVDDADDVSGANGLTEVTFPVATGTTYYIQWDSAYSPKPFAFSFAFNTVACVRVGAYDFYRPEGITQIGATMYWDQSVSLPSNYEIDWSTSASIAAGAGTIVTVPAGSLAFTPGPITGLPSGASYRYFVRSKCGTASTSAWQGPEFGYLAKTLPFSHTFDDVVAPFSDGFLGFTRFTASATSNPADYADGGSGNVLYTFNSATAVSNSRAFTRAISLSANEQVTISFKTRLFTYGTVLAPMSLRLSVGTTQFTAGQTTVLQNYSLTDDTDFTTQTATFTAPSNGIYFFSFLNNSPANAAQTFLFLDTVSLTSIQKIDNFISNKFSVSPNPTTDIVNLSSSENIGFNSLSIADLNGRTVKELKFNNVADAQINMSDLSAGMYLMTISSEQGTATKKIMKN